MTRPLRATAEPCDETAEQQENDGAERGEGDGADAETGGADGAPAEMRTDPPAEQGADYAQGDCDEAAGGIAAGEEELREGTGDEAEDDPMKPEWHAGT